MKIWTCHFVTVCLVVIHVIDSCYKYACMRDNNRSNVGFDDHKESEKVEGKEAIKQDLLYFTVTFYLVRSMPAQFGTYV